MTEIFVKVTKYKDRANWLMYYIDPMTGKRETRSTSQTRKKDALKVAAVWEDELRTGRYKPASNMTWEEFRDRYETEVLPSLKPSTGLMVATAFGHIERILRPKKLSSLTAARLSHLQRELRLGDEDSRGQRKPRSEATVKAYLAHIKAALRWGVDMEILHELPKINMPKRAKGSRMMKGRPIAAEEFERMLAKVESALFDRTKRPEAKMKMSAPKLDPQVRAEVVAKWQQFLMGLWLSGLRLGEALNLWWEDEDGTKLTVDLTGRRPMFRIRGDLEKGGRDRLLPMTPDFAEFLEATPEADRSGPVFPLLGVRGREIQRDLDWVSRTTSKMGRLAGVIVNRDRGKLKYASAHDLRRSFGARWAHKVMPTVLQQLMRHESIETTMKYYVGQDAESVADAVWSAFESTLSPRINTFVNSGSVDPPK